MPCRRERNRQIPSKDLSATASVTPDAIMQLSLAFWGSRTLLSAVELGLFTLAGDGPLSADALTTRLKLHPRRTEAVIDAEDVRGHCRGKIMSFKRQRHVVFVDAFPMTESGKIRKVELREDARKRFAEGAS